MISDLVYDVGLNHGEDTAYYLSKGFRVLAIEANPTLAREACAKFQQAIKERRLTVLNVGVGSDRGTFDFWINDENDDHSSFVPEVGGRNGSKCHAVKVECLPFAEILREYGVPYFLKVDIEKHDRFCLLALDPSDRPKYISIEAHDLEYLCILRALGYNAFRCVDQTSHNHGPLPLNNENAVYRMIRSGLFNWRRVERRFLHRTPMVYGYHFPPGSSGPLPEEIGGAWLGLEQVAYEFLHKKTEHSHRGHLYHKAWFDFHATILAGELSPMDVTDRAGCGCRERCQPVEAATEIRSTFGH